jgi:hypothetical protein
VKGAPAGTQGIAHRAARAGPAAGVTSTLPDRARRGLAVLPALLPGALIVLLAFQSGGFYPSSWAPIAVLAAITLAVRVTVVGRPFAGFSAWSGVSAAALALLATWILLSSGWSDAAGRVVTEFGRLLAYLLVFVICASLAPREHRLSWAIRGVAIAIFALCVVALISRLRPDIIDQPGSGLARLDFPIGYWNALAMLAGVGAILGFHLSASEREPWPVRVLAAALPPVAACTIYFTLSRGGIIATAVGAVAYLLLGFSRATPGALLAIAPPLYVAVKRAYDAEILVDSHRFTTAAAHAEGRKIATAIFIAAAVAMGLRLLAVLLDRAMAGLPGPGRLPVAVRAGGAGVVVLAAIGVALAADTPGWADRQVDTFLHSAPAPVSPDQRSRLTAFQNGGRVAHWNVALDMFRAEKLHGTGAGTFQNHWNRDRRVNMQVLDAHSLYIETLGELGIVGFVLLLVGLLTVFVGLAWRLRGPGRPAAAAVLAATLTWAVHAGVDWDWELAAVTIWMWGLAGIALARPIGAAARGRPMPRVLRLVVGLGCLILVLAPAALWRSQTRLEDAAQAFKRGDCPATIDAALDSLGAVAARAEPWELIAYCDVRLGQGKIAVDAARAAARRDPNDWEYHYALALVLGSQLQDPRPEAARALRLNPLQPEAQAASKALRTSRSDLWERRARRLPLYLR